LNQILAILKTKPFKKFTEQELQSELQESGILPAQSKAAIQKAMLELYKGVEQGVVSEGKIEPDGTVRVEWLSYFGA